MKKGTVRQIIVVLTTIATIVVNGLANVLPLNGQGTGEISNRFDIYFVPANLTFSVWGVIYLGLAAFAVYQALPAQRENAVLLRVGWLFVLSSVANAGWLLLFQSELFVASVPVPFHRSVTI